MAFNYKDYEESEAVRAANAKKAEYEGNAPAAYNSQYGSQLTGVMDKILNRDKFSYDLNGDALYKQYKDKYITQGKMAMADTMGQAAALTGGYGNSYAATVGNQAYQASLQNLNDVVPELYNLAYNKYNQEGQDLLNQYSLIDSADTKDYGKYRDTVSDYNTRLSYLANEAANERNFDYGKYSNDRSLDYNIYSDAEQMAYNKERAAIQDAQWQKNFDASTAPTAATQTTKNVTSLSSTELIDILQSYKDVGDNDSLETFLDDCVNSGRLTPEQATAYGNKYGTFPDVVDTTVGTNISNGDPYWALKKPYTLGK